MRWLLVILCACVPDGAPPIYTSNLHGGLGAACEQDSDCNNATCFTGNNFLGATDRDTFGGFCGRGCSDDSECNSGLCMAGYDGNAYCYPACDAPSHCRDNYLCVTIHSRSVCVPSSVYPALDCDPTTSPCTTFDGDAGSCLRYALGGGNTGLCFRNCLLDVGCHADEACHFTDDAVDKGTFQGTVCWNVLGSQTPVGDPCISSIDCVTGANCVDDGHGAVCSPACYLATGCPNGAKCNQVSGWREVGFCQP